VPTGGTLASDWNLAAIKQKTHLRLNKKSIQVRLTRKLKRGSQSVAYVGQTLYVLLWRPNLIGDRIKFTAIGLGRNNGCMTWRVIKERWENKEVFMGVRMQRRKRVN
jgi:hypothetical protein